MRTNHSGSSATQKPELSFWGIWNISFGFFGIQIAFGLQNANMSRIFQTLGATIDSLPILWIAGPVTGLLVQPLVGYFSDRTWTRFGRRRPYFLVGAILASTALFFMPSVKALWIAAAMLWILDAAINITMEPFRAFVGDMLPARQRTRGFAMQGIFIGVGAVLASVAPYILSNYFGVQGTAPEGIIPESVKISFMIGAVAFFLSVLYTVFTTKEYTPTELEQYEQEEITRYGIEKELRTEQPESRFYLRYGSVLLSVGLAIIALIAAFDGDKQLYIFSGLIVLLGMLFLINVKMLEHTNDQSDKQKPSLLSGLLNDLVTMPLVMKRLAVVQFFSWFALFVMWIYTTPAVTSFHFNSPDPTSSAYAQGADWVGILFALYNGVAAFWALLIPFVVNRLGLKLTHAVGLAAGGIGLISFVVIKDPQLLLIGMMGIGIAWASILTLPYAMLSDILPANKMGTYMGIFNFFIVIPQIVVAGIMGSMMKLLFPDQPISALIIGGVIMCLGAVCMRFVPYRQLTKSN